MTPSHIYDENHATPEMNQEPDPKTEAVFAALRALEGFDEKLLDRPEVKHLHEVLSEGEAVLAIAAGEKDVLAATDRRILRLNTRRSEPRVADEFEYQDIQAVEPYTSSLSGIITIRATGKDHKIDTYREGTREFADATRVKLAPVPVSGGGGSTASATSRRPSKSRKPWLIGVGLTAIVLLVAFLLFGSGPAIPDDLQYEVKRHQSNDVLHFRRIVLRVSINRAVDANVLKAVSDELRSDARLDAAMQLGATSRPQETTIFYYLPGMNIDSGGAWARAEYNDPHPDRKDSITITGNTAN